MIDNLAGYAPAGSIEGDADSFLLAPYDVAVPPQLPGRPVQGDLVGNANRNGHRVTKPFAVTTAES